MDPSLRRELWLGFDLGVCGCTILGFQWFPNISIQGVSIRAYMTEALGLLGPDEVSMELVDMIGAGAGVCARIVVWATVQISVDSRMYP